MYGGSGVWGKKEWGAVQVRDENVVSMDEGVNESVLGGAIRPRARRRGPVGQDAETPHRVLQGSGMTVLVSVVKQMMADGAGIGAVACASTGDTSAALAAYAAAAGIPAIVILPRARVSPAALVQPLANGALVLALDTDFDGCMATCSGWPRTKACIWRTR